MNLIKEILIIFISSSLLLFLFYSITTIIEKLVLKRDSTSAFWRIFIGMLYVVSVYAIVMTMGRTILLPVPIFLFLFQKKIASEKLTVVSKSFEIKFLILSILTNTLYYFFEFTSFDSESTMVIAGDYNVYLRIASKLNQTGLESTSLDSIFRSMDLPNLYHYGDVWLYALLLNVKFLGINSTFSVAFVALSTLFILGIFNLLINRLKNKNSAVNYIVFLLLFAGFLKGIPQFFPSFILKADVYTLSVMNWTKLLIPSCFIIGITILISKKCLKESVLLVCILSFTFINVAPAISGAFFILLFLYFINKQLSFRFLFKQILIFSVFVGGYYAIFYKLVPILLGQTQSNATESTILKSSSFSLKSMFNIFVGGSFQLFTLLPFFILCAIIIYSRKITFKTILSDYSEIIFLFLLLLSGLFVWALFSTLTVDSVQFYTNNIAAFTSIFICFILVYLFSRPSSTVLRACIILFSLISIFYNREKTFFAYRTNSAEVDSISSFLDKEAMGSKLRFVNLQAQKNFNSSFSRNTMFFIPLPYLSYKDINYFNVCLNTPYFNLDTSYRYFKEDYTTIMNSTFFKYKAMNQNMDFENLSLDFISKYNIGYISISNDTVLPPFFRFIVKDSIVLPKSQFTVYRVF